MANTQTQSYFYLFQEVRKNWSWKIELIIKKYKFFSFLKIEIRSNNITVRCTYKGNCRMWFYKYLGALHHAGKKINSHVRSSLQTSIRSNHTKAICKVPYTNWAYYFFFDRKKFTLSLWADPNYPSSPGSTSKIDSPLTHFTNNFSKILADKTPEYLTIGCSANNSKPTWCVKNLPQSPTDVPEL